MFRLQRGRDFLTHEIGRVVQPALAGGVLAVEPTRPNQRQEGVAGFQAVMEALAKVASKRDAVDIHEYRLVADIVRKFERQRSGLSF
jgi:hypothetical protein